MPRAYCPECGHKLERFAIRSDPVVMATSPVPGSGLAAVNTGYHCPQCGRTVDPGEVVRRGDPQESDPDGSDDDTEQGHPSP